MAIALLADADLDALRQDGKALLSLVTQLSQLPHTELAAEALRISDVGKALFIERYETRDPDRHTKIAALQYRNDLEGGVINGALRESLRVTYGIAVYDLIELVTK